MSFEVKCEEGGYSFTRTVNVYVNGISTGITEIAGGSDLDNAADAAAYNLNGQRVSRSARGIIIVNGKKVIK